MNLLQEGTPEESYLRQERRNAVQSILDQMPDMYRIPIILYHQQGLSYKEIADVIDEPLSKSKK